MYNSRIRVQAVAAPAKICGSELELGVNEQTVTEPSCTRYFRVRPLPRFHPLLPHRFICTRPSLCWRICPGTRDVRCAAFLNIPFTAQTLPAVLARTRDVDPTVRRLVLRRRPSRSRGAP